MPVPARPKIYHIVPVENLASIIADGGLIPDAAMAARGGPPVTIGMSSIKHRRLHLPVTCHPGTHVGDYVPFYFCSRSLMLYVIHRGNADGLTYAGGQTPIVHLEADLHRAIDWLTAAARRWAISLSNAGANYAPFRSTVEALEEIQWHAVAATDFRPPEIKEGKQAEFLAHQAFPWTLFDRIGVYSPTVAAQVAAAFGNVAHRPTVEIRRDWYY